jgi:hypothetical protein
MSALISALDTFTPSQLGENGTKEYTWSNDLREKIVQLSFQLVRTKNIEPLRNTTDAILKQIRQFYMSGKIKREEYVNYMSIMFRMIGHTRDVVNGKGEYDLSYMLLDVWHNHHPELAKFAFETFFVREDGTHPYGSWKDLKFFYKRSPKSPLVDHGIDIVLKQLEKDVESDSPSLVAKWVPREKSAHKELFNTLATKFFIKYIECAKTDEKRQKAIIKAKMNFRKLISGLNKKLDTVQIKQCANTWSEIEPEKQTSITLHKQKRAFLNLNKKGEKRSELEDRIQCASKFEEFTSRVKSGEVEVKGKRIGLNDFTKEAIQLERLIKTNSSEITLLNAQWVNNSTQTGALGKMIAMVDVSGSMNGDPLFAAIALGIRVAEKSMLGKRVMTFSESPTWVNLDGIDGFVEMVATVHHAPWGMNTNFNSALTMILDAIIENKLKPEDVEDMVLAIFSDMQMDQADPTSKSLMHTIEKKYAEAGTILWGKPFKPPHILFWNLRSTSGFPTLSTQRGASMMSGFSPSLLNLFCEEGLEALQSCTPWSLFLKSIEHERYNVLDTYLREHITL